VFVGVEVEYHGDDVLAVLKVDTLVGMNDLDFNRSVLLLLSAG
jgi:hypothetical protein